MQIIVGVVLGVEFSSVAGTVLPKPVASGVLAVICIYIAGFAWCAGDVCLLLLAAAVSCCLLLCMSACWAPAGRPAAWQRRASLPLHPLPNHCSTGRVGGPQQGPQKLTPPGSPAPPTLANGCPPPPPPPSVPQVVGPPWMARSQRDPAHGNALRGCAACIHRLLDRRVASARCCVSTQGLRWPPVPPSLHRVATRHAHSSPARSLCRNRGCCGQVRVWAVWAQPVVPCVGRQKECSVGALTAGNGTRPPPPHPFLPLPFFLFPFFALPFLW